MGAHHRGGFRGVNVNLLFLILLSRHGLRHSKSYVNRLVVTEHRGRDRVAPLVVDYRVCSIVKSLGVDEILCRRGSSSLVFDRECELLLSVICAIRQCDDNCAVDVFLSALSRHILDKEAKLLADELL